MKARAASPGFSIVEVLVSLSIFSLAMGGLAVTLVQNSQINRTEQMAAEVQSNARTCLSMVVQVLRSAGYDPRNAGFASVTLDPAPTNTSNFIEVFADLNEDGDTADEGEDVTIRFAGNRVEWRTSSDTSQPFLVVADGISNDADGDGVTETMFVPDSMTNPRRVTVRVTARSPLPDSRSGDYLRYTVSSEVALRKNL